MLSYESDSLTQPEGLTIVQVEKLTSDGQVNIIPNTTIKTTKQILKENICTLFNLLNLFIAIVLFSVHAYSNMFFFAIILLNITIGIVQEITARNLVESLSILNALQVKTIRDNELQIIPVDQLVLGDIIRLQTGDQIPSDSCIVSGSIEVNESLLTGEVDEILKEVNNRLYSGSYVVSGFAYATVEHVGLDNYSSKIATQAKQDRGIHSELIDSMRTITNFTSFIIVPLGIILFLESYYWHSSTTVIAVTSTAAALLGMLPKGLVLLMSLSSATGVIKLSKKNVLVQDMHCLETLAHVDILCLDKTGTLTKGQMEVVDKQIFQQVFQGHPFEEIMGNYVYQSDDHNATMEAVRVSFPSHKNLNVSYKISFSSDRKWSSITFEGLGTIIVGAPELILAAQDEHEELEKATQNGNRALAVGITIQDLTKDTLNQVEIEPLAFFVFDDAIRENATETLNYFKEEGVNLKIISGDNPKTVASIAQKVGFENSEAYIDLSQLETDDELTDAAKKYSIFGRVSPKQKQQLVQAFQAQGHTVAMTGDGVNDVLALREADVGIAMSSGNDAAKQIAELVLLDSNFGSLPSILGEGRRTIHNITKVASVFFIKTMYSVVLSILCAIFGITFPFLPIQITMNDLIIEGYPALFLSFEEDNRKVITKFLPTALKSALPNALLVVFDIIAVYLMTPVLGFSQTESVTLMYYLMGFVSILAVIKTCLPFNKLRAFLAVTDLIGYYVAIYLFRHILGLGTLTGATLPIFSILILVNIAFRTKSLYEAWKGKKNY
ncbi:HAD-IC family P-type ATPase [Clostridium bowmanii]|uniref:HAD-IC family P-type ATPase n=1 Tax=Clostridium bowmanii TaxID=132925 RepID=UPI001C0AC50D|nr:HAD-IC family P-type ATPase [Clostridium bowmanii]MBU3192285.1 HAD-IC family P-type ATPase [Clostridium bowmanii]MCA1076514.1 HAD-IC family P-type ATPase [Clostridium bowmanii]